MHFEIAILFKGTLQRSQKASEVSTISQLLTKSTGISFTIPEGSTFYDTSYNNQNSN